MSLLDTASLIVTPNGYKASKLYSVKPTDASGDMTVVRATTATRVNSAGLIESVATNVPRLDYPPLGGCPSILVEPQRTNLALRSEEFDNATWTTNGLNATVSANVTTSPDGTSSADAILTTITNGLHYIQQRTGSAIAGTTYTMSVYVKYLGYDYCQLQTSNTGSAIVVFRFSTKTVTLSGAQVVANSGIVTEMANGWFRIQVSVLPLSSAGWRWWIVCLNDSAQDSFIGDVTKGLYVWGFQFEVGSNATSYIPTVASSVTRNADVISQTGISSLIGQTEGTFFCEMSALKNTQTASVYMSVFASGTNFTSLGFVTGTNKIVFEGIYGGVSIFYIYNAPFNININSKIAVAYQLNKITGYVNGIKVFENTTAQSFSQTLTQFKSDYRGLGNFLEANVKSIQLYKTRLTDTELAQLTTL